MYTKLQEAIRDGDISMALRRLHNNIRLKEVGAPPSVVDKSIELLDRSKELLGDRFAIVEQFYPEYSVHIEAEHRVENAWMARCGSCRHWSDDRPPEAEEWCDKHSFDSRTYPDPCPDYSDGEMND